MLGKGRRSRLSHRESVTSTGTVYRTDIKKKHKKAELEEFKAEYSIDDHVIPLYALEERYNTNSKRGITQKQADERLILEGPNVLPTPAMKSKWLILADFLFCGFALILWVSAIMSFVVYGINVHRGRLRKDQLYFGIVIIIVIIVTGVFGFYQEASNEAIIDNFKKLTPKFATVIRDGQTVVIPSEEVVMGDVVELKAGEWIPADIRLTQTHQLKVDNSAITGESAAVSRSTECTDKNPMESSNVVFFSTCVVEGSGRGIVVRRGENTLIGRIAELTSTLEKGETPIRKEIKYFIKFITILSFGIAMTFFVICMCYGRDFFTSFVYFIALVIANVPEGLPVTLTACMTLTSKRMASKNCLVKKLEAIETLGCCNVICSDKTGTLTQNKMKVVHIYYDNQSYYVLGDTEGLDRHSQAFQALSNIAILCSRADFLPNQDPTDSLDDMKATGDASEIAIFKCMYELFKVGVQSKRDECRKVCEIPFNSTNKYQISIHKMFGGHMLMMKGAPERILDRCSTILRFGETKAFADDTKRGVKKAVNHLGERGERVLAFADLFLPLSQYPLNYRFDPETVNFPLRDLRFVGLISMIDPPRPSVPNAVAKCKTAGIRVIMVTGDHPLTAAAIAKQVGILSHGSITSYDIALRRDVSVSMVSEKERMLCTAAVVTGNDLREMDSAHLQTILLRYDEIVFARTSPQQKLKIVEAFQGLGNVVAVTGDGVNDSPALKKADIGIAMGITGTDVSKDAADMILLDDNFSSIVVGIEEGRLIFDNLKKSIAYLLTSNVPEITPFVVMVIWNVPPVISVLAILVIDVGTDLWPAISLAYEKPEADIMHRNPRDPHYDKLVNYRLIMLTYCQIGVIQACASFASFFLIMAMHGFHWHSLFGIGDQWRNETAIIIDSYGQHWNYNERMVLKRKCFAGFFMTIVITQIADLLICKTRKLSLLQQGMTNWVLNFGIFFELILAVSVVYIPGLNTVLEFDKLEAEMFLVPAVPFAVLIVIYDEARRWAIRRFPGGVIDRNTYY